MKSRLKSEGSIPTPTLGIIMLDTLIDRPTAIAIQEWSKTSRLTVLGTLGRWGFARRPVGPDLSSSQPLPIHVQDGIFCILRVQSKATHSLGVTNAVVVCAGVGDKYDPKYMFGVLKPLRLKQMTR